MRYDLEMDLHQEKEIEAYYIWENRIAAGTAGDQLSDWLKGEKIIDAPVVVPPVVSTAVSFTKDIHPLFRPVDIEHMSNFGILLADYVYMSDSTGDHANAKRVLQTLTEQAMPPGGPFWPQADLDLFAKWMTDGYSH